MNWQEAVEAMREGHSVQRKSEQRRELIVPGDDLNIPVFEGGEEPMYLAAAWSEDDKPTKVFMGRWSRCLFVPDQEHLSATDWVIAEEQTK